MRCRIGRGRGIRTPDILLPKQARYQTALYPAGGTAPGLRTTIPVKHTHGGSRIVCCLHGGCQRSHGPPGRDRTPLDERNYRVLRR